MWKLQGSTFVNRPSTYVLKGCYKELPPPPKKILGITGILGAKAFLVTIRQLIDEIFMLLLILLCC